MHTTCTDRRACTRHLARGVAGPVDERDRCGAMTADDVRDAVAFASSPARFGHRRMVGAIVALAEQFRHVTAQRDALVAAAERIERAYEQADHEPPCLRALYEAARGEGGRLERATGEG